MAKTLEIQDTPLFSYPLASGDMRYIAIGEREIYLKDVPPTGLVFRGEIPGCGSECYVELNEILLEYAMSCEGCREESAARVEVTSFGEHLGKILLAKINESIAEQDIEEKLVYAFECVLNSMSSKYTKIVSTERLEFSLDCCPLRECARDTGLNRSVEMAQVSFIALCNYLLSSIAPDWELVSPEENSDSPIHRIDIALI